MKDPIPDTVFQPTPDGDGLEYLEGEPWAVDPIQSIRTDSPAMTRVYDQINMVAGTRTTVLLTGQTGTGKSFAARLIHHYSDRRTGPFIGVHCGAIPESLIESELFGHEKGAFTGAVRRKRGRFELARGGTIFLDEIGTITPAIQIKLLQVLQDRTFQPVGGERALEADVRILAASNADLENMVAQGQFRDDLFYRLNVFPIRIPNLNERREDIPFLVDIFLKRLNLLHGKSVSKVAAEVLQAFREYSWPGNIRELENLIERAYILEKTDILSSDGFPREFFQGKHSRLVQEDDRLPSLAQFRARAVAAAEEDYLRQVLTLCRGRIDKSAQTAGITTRQFHKIMKRHGLRKEDFKI